MQWFKDVIVVHTRAKGLVPVTDAIQQRIDAWRLREGLCVIFLQHTSASLIINESYDPSARNDLEVHMDRAVPEDPARYIHTLEGPDDSPSHIRTMLTHTSLTIPVDEGRLSLGTWQGIYLFEHRTDPQRRRILIRGLSVDGG